MLSPDETQAMVMLGALESIRSGTTALIEISRNTETFAPALETTGLRLVLAEVMEDLAPSPQNSASMSTLMTAERRVSKEAPT